MTKPEYTDEDMANVGRALMDRLPDGYSYMDCPTEIVTDLQNEVSDLKEELAQLQIDYDRACGRVAELEDVHTNATI